MRFVPVGRSIECQRLGSDGAYHHVVSFDAHLELIAPHVAAVLSGSEQHELRLWFSDRGTKRNP